MLSRMQSARINLAKLAFAAGFDVLVAMLVSWRLAVILAALAILVASALMAARLVVDYAYPFIERAADFCVRWAQTHNNAFTWMLRGIPYPKGPELPLIVILTAVLIGALAAFLAILEDVVTGDPLVVVDQLCYQLLQRLRSYWGDYGLVAVTELGDAQVVIPVAVAAAVAFLAVGNWRAAKYLLVVFLGASAWVDLVKLLLQRSRPVDLYSGASSFSFPSGHATISIALYGFLALLLQRDASPGLRRALTGATLALVVLIAFSRMYLGAHWFSDVLAGLSFGAAWVAMLAIAYFRVAPIPIPSGPLSALVLAVLAVSGAFHVIGSHTSDLNRYSVTERAAEGARLRPIPNAFWKWGQ